MNLPITRNVSTTEAFNAGYDYGLRGANTTNCHFSLFATKELTAAWEAGKRAGETDKATGATPKRRRKA